MNTTTEPSPVDLSPAREPATFTLIDGEQVAAGLRRRIRSQVAAFRHQHGHPPALATIRIGESPLVKLHAQAQIRACAETGIRSFEEVLPADTPQPEVLALIDRLNDDERVSGILCQLPVPAHLDPVELINRIDPGKDVDGLTFANAGRLAIGASGLRPCTPLGVMLLLREAGVELRGKHAVVIGSSNLVGKPLTQLMLAAGATVTQCHRHTHRLPHMARRADVLVVAAGRPELVRGSWIKPGAVVVDIGINRLHGRTVGDVCHTEAAGIAAALTPVPGGVGPMTIACLLSNTLRAAQDQQGCGRAPIAKPAVSGQPALRRRRP